jgi:hypothetical protein
MKQHIGYIIVSLAILIASGNRNAVSAQSSAGVGVPFMVAVPASSITTCAWPSGTGVPVWTGSNTVALCIINAGGVVSQAYSVGGNATFTALGGTAAGVTSFNGRTGAVILTNADVTGTGLKVVTTSTAVVTSTSTPQ